MFVEQTGNLYDRFQKHLDSIAEQITGEPSMATLYGIKNCDTVKKARRWLDQNGIAYQFHDYRTDGLTAELLKHFADHLGWDTLLNRSSTSWRQLSTEQQADLTEEKALQLMLNTPTLIKRPILDTGKKLIIGFKIGEYETGL